jgi:hypothetical protein
MKADNRFHHCPNWLFQSEIVKTTTIDCYNKTYPVVDNLNERGSAFLV